MDKEEFRIKLDQINHLVEAKDYKGAMEVVDSIDWRRVKNVRTLCVVGEIYAANKRYEDSRDIFLLAYHRASIGKNILVRLVEVSLKMGEIDEAMEYYEEFCSVAPNDNTAFILRYKILSTRNAPLEDQIQVLEEYKNREFTEKWSYELAKLYYMAGHNDKAEDLCNEMILWFSEGTYIIKAYDLKQRMGIITDSEKSKLEKAKQQRKKAREIQKEKASENKEEEEPVVEEVEITKEKASDRLPEESEEGSKEVRERDQEEKPERVPSGRSRRIISKPLKEEDIIVEEISEYSGEETVSEERPDEASEGEEQEVVSEEEMPEEVSEDMEEADEIEDEISEEVSEDMEDTDVPEEEITEEESEDTEETNESEEEISEEISDDSEEAVVSEEEMQDELSEDTEEDIISEEDIYEKVSDRKYKDSDDDIVSEEVVEEDISEDTDSQYDLTEEYVHKKAVKKKRSSYREEADEEESEEDGPDDTYDDESGYGEEIPEEAGQEEGFEEDEEEDYGEDTDQDFEDDSDSLIGKIRIKNEKELEGAETLSEKIVKGLKSLFGGRRRAEEYDDEEEEDEEASEEPDEEIEFPDNYDIEEEPEEEEDSGEYEESEEPEDSEESDESEEPEESEETEESEKTEEESDGIRQPDESEKSDGSEKMKSENPLDDDFDDDFDEEDEEEELPENTGKKKKRQFKFPEFRIPRSIKKNRKAEKPEEETDIPVKEKEKEEKKEKKEPEEVFNLEDTILAAAFAQGIEIPGAAPSKKDDADDVKKYEMSSSKKNKTEDILSSGDDEDSEIEEFFTSKDEEEPVVMERMISSEEEKSIESLEKNSRNTAEDTDESAEDVPDLIMPDLNSVLDEDFEENDFTEEGEDEVSQKNEMERESLAAEIVEGENEEDVDEEELLVSSVIGEEEVSEPDEDEDDEDLSEEEKIEDFISSIQPDTDTGSVNIIPRSKELSEDEIKLFSYFLIVPGMKEQIVDALYDVQIEASNKTSSTGNIIVMGGPESGKTRLISGLIPAICKELHLEASKVAYVFAEQINGKDISKIVSRLKGGFLVIENANQLDQETAVNLTKAMDGDTQGMIFILEDNKIGMRKMMARYPKLAKKFTSVINIPVFTNDELANFAKIYAMEKGYRIDNMGMIALYNMISINQKEDMPMNVGAVKEMVDAAIQKSQGGIGIFRKNAVKKRTDQNGFIVLYDKDFVKGK